MGGRARRGQGHPQGGLLPGRPALRPAQHQADHARRLPPDAGARALARPPRHFAAAGFIAQETVDQEPWGFYWGLNDAWNAFYSAPRRLLIPVSACVVSASRAVVCVEVTDSISQK